MPGTEESVFYYRPDTEKGMVIAPELELVVFSQSEFRMEPGCPVRSQER